jgi:hypothetical protein
MFHTRTKKREGKLKAYLQLQHKVTNQLRKLTWIPNNRIRDHTFMPKSLTNRFPLQYVNTASNDVFFRSTVLFPCRMYSRGSSCIAIWKGNKM